MPQIKAIVEAIEPDQSGNPDVVIVKGFFRNGTRIEPFGVAMNPDDYANIAQLQAAIAPAVVAAGEASGFTLTAQDVMSPSFQQG